MNLQQIIDRVDLLISNDLPIEQKVLQIEQIQRQLFRQMPLPDKIHKFETTPGAPYYDLPVDCAEDRIRHVIINDTSYIKVSVDEKYPPEQYCTVIVGKLYIYPNPSYAGIAYLYYRPRHDELSANRLNQKPSFPEDYHDLLVYGCSQWIAGIQRDVDLVNNFQSEFEEILKEAKKHFKPIGPSKVRITQRW